MINKKQLALIRKILKAAYNKETIIKIIEIIPAEVFEDTLELLVSYLEQMVDDD